MKKLITNRSTSMKKESLTLLVDKNLLYDLNNLRRQKVRRENKRLLLEKLPNTVDTQILNGIL